MSLVIPDEFLQLANLSENDQKLEIAILLVQQNKITLNLASQFAETDQQNFQQLLVNRNIGIENGTDCDACYAVLARQIAAPLLTQDQRLVNALTNPDIDVQLFSNFVVPSFP